MNGAAQLLAPGVGVAKGTRFLPNGDVVLALPETSTVDLVSMSGGQVTLASMPSPNGIAVDLHGNVWAATSSGHVKRVTPDGDVTIVAEVAGSCDGIAFSPDYRTLYFNSEFGQVRKIAVDENGEVEGPFEPFVSVPITLVSILDGMTTDVCGNLYVVRMDGRVFRYLPDGTLDGSINFNSAPGLQMIPAANFGSGFGGFERDKLYAMNFLGGVLEADIGIEGRWEPHYPIPQ
jgi:sugar lactone lactonase YvrE